MFESSLGWIRQDWNTNPVRFAMEVTAWSMSIGCAITMAVTVPNPPLIPLYVFWISGCMIYAWAAWTRQSFGMLANYLLLVTIDLVGLARMLAKIM